jgi:hypothetical protein
MMASFGGNEFHNFSIPLVFEERYFILEPGDIPNITVVIEKNGKPIFEIIKNEPAKNEITEVSKTSAGIITVSDMVTQKFLYKVLPASETSVTFGKLGGNEIAVKISDKNILIGSNLVRNNIFNGNKVGLAVGSDGIIRMGGPIPNNILNWFI